MNFDLLEEAIRLSIFAAISSILASAVLFVFMTCRQRIIGYFETSRSSELVHDSPDPLSNDVVIPMLFAITEFSLTGCAIIFGLVKHGFHLQ